jgi:hypothetical protein
MPIFSGSEPNGTAGGILFCAVERGLEKTRTRDYDRTQEIKPIRNLLAIAQATIDSHSRQGGPICASRVNDKFLERDWRLSLATPQNLHLFLRSRRSRSAQNVPNHDGFAMLF